jgi:hypothetical protein
MGEGLFLRGVTPWTPVRDVPDLPLVALEHRLLDTSRVRGVQSPPVTCGRAHELRPRPVRAPVPALPHADPGGTDRRGPAGPRGLLTARTASRAHPDGRRPPAAAPRGLPRQLTLHESAASRLRWRTSRGPRLRWRSQPRARSGGPHDRVASTPSASCSRSSSRRWPRSSTGTRRGQGLDAARVRPVERGPQLPGRLRRRRPWDVSHSR